MCCSTSISEIITTAVFLKYYLTNYSGGFWEKEAAPQLN